MVGAQGMDAPTTSGSAMAEAGEAARAGTYGAIDEERTAMSAVEAATARGYAGVDGGDSGMQLASSGEEGAVRDGDATPGGSRHMRKTAFVGLAAILAVAAYGAVALRRPTSVGGGAELAAQRDGDRSPRQSSSGNAKQPPDEHTSVGDTCDPLRALFRAEYWAGV